MIGSLDIPSGWALLVSVLLLAGASLTFLGSLGLLRLDDFFQRLHSPTLGTTLGTGSILVASMIYFSVTGGRPVLHEILLAAFLTLTTPITFVLLVRAGRYRDQLTARLRAQKDQQQN